MRKSDFLYSTRPFEYIKMCKIFKAVEPITSYNKAKITFNYVYIKLIKTFCLT